MKKKIIILYIKMVQQGLMKPPLLQDVDIKKQTGNNPYAFIQFVELSSAIQARRRMDREFVGRNRVKVPAMKNCVMSSYLCYCLCASETLCVNMLTFLHSEFIDSCCWMSGCKVAVMILSLFFSLRIMSKFSSHKTSNL